MEYKYDYNKILDELRPFKMKSIICIKDFINKHTSEQWTEQGNFYLIERFNYTSETDSNQNKNILNINITLSPSISGRKFIMKYSSFIEHFELRTIQDIRRDKIKSILK